MKQAVLFYLKINIGYQLRYKALFNSVVLLFIFVFINNMSNAQCNVSVSMSDSYGDGWNGGNLEFFFDGISQGTYAATGNGSNANLTIPAGQTMTVNYTSGSWEGENQYTISIGGSLVFADGPTPSTGLVYNYDCPGPGGCSDTEILLTMNDSFGDGWNGAALTLIGNNGTNYGPYTVTTGSNATETICLPDDCYTIEVSAGSWPTEISWNITEGGSIIASGGAPALLTGNFSTGSANCAPPCPVPPNNFCNNAPLLDLNINNNQTYSGTGCGSSPSLGTVQDVWVAFEVPCGGMDITIDFCGSTPVHNNSYINIFNDCSLSSFIQANNWDFTTCSDGNISLFWNNLPAGTYYFPIYIDPLWQTDFDLNITGVPLHTVASPPIGISGNNNICSGQNTSLTLQGGSPGTSGTPQWFAGSCGSAVIGTGNSINISPGSTTTYFVRYNGTCNTTSCTSVTVNVDQPSTPPTLSGGGTVCFGENVILIGNGGNVAPANWVWHENNINGPQLGNGASVTVSPTTTTDYVVELPANGGCPASASNAVTVTLPTPDHALSGNNAQSTCTVNQNGYVHFLDPNGKLIASINSNGQNLGEVIATSYVESSPLLVATCNNPNPLHSTSVLDRHWVITPEFQPVGPVEVLLPLSQTEEQSLVLEANGNNNPDDDLMGLAEIVLTKYSGPINVDNIFPNNCINQGGNETLDLFLQTSSGLVNNYWPLYSGVDYFASYTINSFSEFWLHGSTVNNSPLPVQLTYFSTGCENDKVLIEWETASEQNSSHFDLERSRDGQYWELVSTVAGAGNSSSINKYEVSDYSIGSGIYYYRLLQEDFDGNQQLFNAISTNCYGEGNSVVLFPNPASDAFQIIVNSTKDHENTMIVIYDLNGRKVESENITIKKGDNMYNFSGSHLSKGMFIVEIHGANDVFSTKKLIIH
jgi:hypothetical protein